MLRSRAFQVIARPGVAAAGICAPIATIAVVAGGYAWMGLAVGAWAILVGFVVAAPRLWPGMTAVAARGALVTAWAASIIAWVVGVAGEYAVTVDHALCGNGGGAATVALVGAATVYLGGSVWALRGGRRAVWAWPLLVFAGWGAHVLLLFALPGAHGFCET